MQKQPKNAVSRGWLVVCGLVMMLATSACETVPVEPTSASTSVVKKPTIAEADPPERPIKPGG